MTTTTWALALNWAGTGAVVRANNLNQALLDQAPQILKAMRRPYDSADYLRRVDQLQAGVPGMNLVELPAAPRTLAGRVRKYFMIFRVSLVERLTYRADHCRPCWCGSATSTSDSPSLT